MSVNTMSFEDAAAILNNIRKQAVAMGSSLFFGLSGDRYCAGGLYYRTGGVFAIHADRDFRAVLRIRQRADGFIGVHLYVGDQRAVVGEDVGGIIVNEGGYVLTVPIYGGTDQDLLKSLCGLVDEDVGTVIPSKGGSVEKMIRADRGDRAQITWGYFHFGQVIYCVLDCERVLIR